MTGGQRFLRKIHKKRARRLDFLMLKCYSFFMDFRIRFAKAEG